MSWGINIAIGLGSAVVFRAISNAAYQATLPQVDPNMPSAGPVLAAAGVPGVAGGVAMAYKYPKIASALFGIAAGGAISTAEYMAYAREAQALPVASKGAYYWVLVHKDASLDNVEAGPYTESELPAKDALVLKQYGTDPDIIQITRKNPDGTAVTLVTKQSAGAVRLQSGAAFRMRQAGGLGVPQFQSGSAVRISR